MVELKKQWHEENSLLLEVEKEAMERITKGDDKEFGLLKDGKAYWCIGFKSKLSGRKYTVALVYPEDHPSKKEIPGIRVYPVEPPYEMMVEERNRLLGKKDTTIPYSMKDCDGNYYLSVCSIGWFLGGNILESKLGIISAAEVLLETKRLIFFYEKEIADQRQLIGRRVSADYD